MTTELNTTGGGPATRAAGPLPGTSSAHLDRPAAYSSHQDEIDYVTGRSGSRDIVDMACRLLLLRDALEDCRRALREADRRCIIGDAFSNAYARQTMRNVADRIDAALTAEGA